MQIILASASPRRKDLLQQIGLVFRVMTSDVEENTKATTPKEVVQELATIKATAVWEQLSEEEQDESLVIGADTVVAYQGEILGKPKNEEEACRMLSMLSNNTHQVYTGVSLVTKEKRYTFFECTEVSFFELSEEEIDRYVSSGDPMDKAGAYGIQGAFAAYVKGIHGDYNNVVGLPVARLYQELKEM